MKRWKNGEYLEMSAEEIITMQSELAKAEAYERTRPLTESEVFHLLIK